MIDLWVPGELAGSFAFRLIIAGVLGALIGLERDIHGRPAGLRTHLLVAAGAALFTLVSLGMAQGARLRPEMAITSDPARIAAQVVTGIGFLGAGAIIKEGFTIRGLTTAASLWIVAGIGMASGAGMFDAAVLATILSLVGLVILNVIEHVYAKDEYRAVEVTTACDVDTSPLRESLGNLGAKILGVNIARDHVANEMRITYIVRLFFRDRLDDQAERIIADLEASGVELRSIRWYTP